MKERLKVEGDETLERDTSNQAILSNNQTGYRAALARRNYLIKQKEEINNLKDEVSEVKNLLKTLIEKIDK